ncbi:MAG: hypothetical protein K1X55_04720 [Chitinophagales bacterium]|nr:hypothetical protein [Chitinophagales bacterium]
MTSILLPLAFLLVMIIVYKGMKNDSRQLQNSWSQYFDSMRISSKDFYARLAEELAIYEVKDLATKEVSLSEGGLFSSNRLYMRISWQEFQYDLCVAPFGNSATFISWWLWRTPPVMESAITNIPVVGVFLNRVVSPVTYYRIDSSNSFMQFTQSKVLKILDEIIKEQNITALPEFERYPIKQSIHINTK